MAGKWILLLRLEGPLQSWGGRSRWDVRDSEDEPTKSGVIGLLGCALGYPVGDSRLEELDRRLRLGIRVENPGRKLTDYHTVTGMLQEADGGVRGSEDNPSTIISPRTYLQDAAFLAALDGPGETLESLAAALQHPIWPIYLGRKACPPARPVFDALTDVFGSIGEALGQCPWDWGGKAALGGKHPDSLRCLVEDSEGETVRPDRIRTNPARMYGFRRIRIYYTAFPGLKEEDYACISPD